MKKKLKVTETKTAKELAKALGLSHADGTDIEARSGMNDKIIEVVQKRRLTHENVAKLAKTSRTRVTAILNRSTQDVSTDLLMRILTALGVSYRIQFDEDLREAI